MIDIQRIETFICAAENSSLSEAAKQLHLSQPAVSHQIKLLEQDLGVSLFIRSNIGLTLTEAGQILLPWARTLLHDMDNLEEMLSSLHEVVAGEMNIACSTSAGKYVLPKLATRFCLLYPQIKMHIQVCKHENIIPSLLEGKAHLGIVSTEINDIGLESQEFFRDTIDLIVPANHPWAEKLSVEPEDIVSEPMFIREETSGTRRVMMEELSKFDISLEDLNVFMEIGSAEGIMEAISTGYGISFVSRLASWRLRELGKIASVRLDSLNIQRVTYVVRKRISPPRHRLRDVFWGFVHTPENEDLLHGSPVPA